MAQAEDNSAISKLEESNKKISYSEHYINKPAYSEQDLVGFRDAWLKKHEHIIAQEPFSGQASLQPYLQAKIKDKNFWNNVFGLGPFGAQRFYPATMPPQGPPDQQQLQDPPLVPPPPAAMRAPPPPQPPSTTTPAPPARDDAVVPSSTMRMPTRVEATFGPTESDSHISTMGTKIVPIVGDTTTTTRFNPYDETKPKRDSEMLERGERTELDDITKKGSFYALPESVESSTALSKVQSAQTLTDDGKDKRTELRTDDLIALDKDTGIPPGATQGTDDPSTKLGSELLVKDNAYNLHFARDADRFKVTSKEEDDTYTNTIKKQLASKYESTMAFLNYVGKYLTTVVIDNSEKELNALNNMENLAKRNDFDEFDKQFDAFNVKYNYLFANALEARLYFENQKNKYAQEQTELARRPLPQDLVREYERAAKISLSDEEFNKLLSRYDSKPLTVGESRGLVDFKEAAPGEKNIVLQVYNPTLSDILTKSSSMEDDNIDPGYLTNPSEEFTRAVIGQSLGAIESTSEQLNALGSVIREQDLVPMLGRLVGDYRRLDQLLFESASDFPLAEKQRFTKSVQSIIPVVDNFLARQPANLYVRALKSLLVEAAQQVDNVQVVSERSDIDQVHLIKTQKIMEDIIDLGIRADMESEKENFNAKEKGMEIYSYDLKMIEKDLNNFLYKGATMSDENKRVEYKKIITDLEKLTTNLQTTSILSYPQVMALTTGVLPLLYNAVKLVKDLFNPEAAKMGYGLTPKPKTLQWYDVDEAQVMDHYMNKNLPKPIFLNASMIKKQAAGCGSCGGNNNLRVHMRDDDDLMCRICLAGKGMTKKRYSPYTTQFLDLRKSKVKKHRDIYKQHNINAHLDQLTAEKAQPTLWEEFNSSAKINKNFVQPYSSSYMMNRPANSKRDVDKLTYLLGKLEHDSENMTPYARANLLTLANNHLKQNKAFPENNLLKASGLRININAFDTFDSLKDHLNTNPYFLNFLLV
jgi:hypothetical protein